MDFLQFTKHFTHATDTDLGRYLNLYRNWPKAIGIVRAEMHEREQLRQHNWRYKHHLR